MTLLGQRGGGRAVGGPDPRKYGHLVGGGGESLSSQRSWDSRLFICTKGGYIQTLHCSPSLKIDYRPKCKIRNHKTSQKKTVENLVTDLGFGGDFFGATPEV